MQTESAERVLMITAIPGAQECATTLQAELRSSVEVVASRRDGLTALRRGTYTVVIVDEAIASADEDGADQLWKHSGLAVPVHVNFAISGSPRMVREVRAALRRRQQEQILAMRAAAASLEAEVRSSLTGLLLQAQLALGEPALTPRVAGRLKIVVELANDMRQRLETAHG